MERNQGEIGWNGDREKEKKEKSCVNWTGEKRKLRNRGKAVHR
jgi:hypothetical protein